MDENQLKNMVVLRNLPSNIVDEAYVVLKSNKKVKKLEKIEKNINIKKGNDEKKDKEYVLKEAEILLEDYISKIENTKKENNLNNNNIFKKTKIWAYISSIIAFIESIIIFS